MKKTLLSLLLLGASLFASSIEVKDGYARATPPNLPNSAAFMSITNNSDKDVALVWAKSNVSNVAELHTHDMKDGVMKMYQVPKIDIKANSTTTLQPGGFHIMLIDLIKKPLTSDQTVTLTLGFSNKEEMTLTIPVKTVMNGMNMNKMNMNHGNMKN
ncbi:MAG: copper chaperone PCu(A)C [Candidatus Marinarcus sp.]|uniref:copper chaperone PCu(A)C n=1 Tax=Candidatus Marinarcus sp. TaxID=3100987 RepID=UPI003AFFB8C8